MKTLIFLLVILAFVQTTILPLDLVLLILICRSYLKTDQANLYLAFGFGLLISFLNLSTLGLLSIIYLIIVQLTQTLSKSPLAGRLILIIPISFAFLLVYHHSLQIFPKVIIESLLSLPILYFVKLWEERFMVSKEIKLRLRS